MKFEDKNREDEMSGHLDGSILESLRFDDKQGRGQKVPVMEVFASVSSLHDKNQRHLRPLSLQLSSK